MKKLSPSTIAMLRHGFINHKGQRWRREETRRWKCIAKVLMQDWAMQADRILEPGKRKTDEMALISGSSASMVDVCRRTRRLGSAAYRP